MDRRAFLGASGTGIGAIALGRPSPAVAKAAAASRSTSVKVRPYRESTHAAVAEGEYVPIYDPSVGRSGPWMVNDHTIIRGDDGTWHLFGISHSEPQIGSPNNLDQFGHATAPALHGPWTTQEPVLYTDEARGESHLWAPHVVRHDGVYYMFYNGGGEPEHNHLSLAVSRDLFHWERHGDGPLFTDGWVARDPFVTRVDGQWVMYYMATRDPADNSSPDIVAYRTSADLLTWGPRNVAFDSGPNGRTESPFVVERPGGRFYLFVGPRRGHIPAYFEYSGTDVFESRNPFAFDPQKLVGHLHAHAPEIIYDDSRPGSAAGNHEWYVSHCGWGNQGVHLAPLKWHHPQKSEGVRVKAPGYSAELRTAPYAELTSLRFELDGEYREVLSLPFRGTRPYMGTDGFGMRQVPGAPRRVAVEDNRVTLSGVKLGYQPVTFDWIFEFGEETIDMSIVWHVHSTTTALINDVGWNLDLAYPRIGDDARLDRRANVRRFPKWVLGHDSASTLVAAYREGSSWSEDNLNYAAVSDDNSSVAWQEHWSQDGGYLHAGDYPGGTWRIGASAQPADTEFASQLHASLNRAT